MAILNAASAASELFIAIDAPIPDMSGLKDPDVSATKDIELRDVSFAYPTRAHTAVLNNLNVRFEAGKTTAIVGPSGSGKSTIVGLIQRWYEPTDPKDIKPEKADDASSHESEKEKGDEASNTEKNPDSGVFVGGVRLDAVDIQWWRMNVGLVSQEPFLFNDTIFNNVANGLSGTKYNDLPKEEKIAMVKQACDEAYASGFIERLPEGYDTLVGESGIKISGGQRQRLSIARAIIKQPPILILDEATSSIDVRTEKVVQQALDRVSEGRTTITIAHRLSTIKRADKIVVLRGGEVVEEGSHSQLLENEDGIYSGLVRAQAIEMGDDDQNIDIQQDEIEQFKLEEEKVEKDDEMQLFEEKEWKPRGVIRSLGFLLYEQRRNWLLYTLAIMAGIMGGGSSITTSVNTSDSDSGLPYPVVPIRPPGQRVHSHWA
jgi:ATP-binding cassette subfamily B (MDR/TAP) protein 1